MNSDETMVVTYHDNGSKKQGTGSFSVQGLTINGKFRALPAMQIASESQKNTVTDLKVAVLNLVKAASGVSLKLIFEKLDSIMTEKTSHNFKVVQMVSESLELEHQPEHLFCNVHPSLMFNLVITKTWNDIKNVIG